MLHDHVAECLEKKGLYRRAAERWAKVMVQLSDDQKSGGTETSRVFA